MMGEFLVRNENSAERLWCDQQESNLYLSLRRTLFYPLNYGHMKAASTLYRVGTKFYDAPLFDLPTPTKQKAGNRPQVPSGRTTQRS